MTPIEKHWPRVTHEAATVGRGGAMGSGVGERPGTHADSRTALQSAYRHYNQWP